MQDYVSKVNPLQGTRSTREFSTGNTLPLCTRPWGMHHWTFQTAAGPWYFHPEHRKLQGIRLTHQPSPWMGEYASLLISAFTGTLMDSAEKQSSAWRIEDAAIHPHRLGARLLRYGITMEMAPSNHGGIFVFTKESAAELKVVFRFQDQSELNWRSGSSKFSAVLRDNNGGVPDNFGLQVAGEFDSVPIKMEETAQGRAFTFEAGRQRVELRIAGSFLSEEIARLAICNELSGKTLQAIATEGAECWNTLLGRLRIEEAYEHQSATFYSCLYRCLLFPRLLDELDGNGQTVHYSPYDGRQHSGSLCTDNGFWDTFRTVYPLLGLVYPDKLAVILNGWLNACRQAGWSPKWASPGLRDCMIGTHFDAVIADAVAKDIRGWDRKAAYQFLLKNATVQSQDGRYGRKALEDYCKLGYVPVERAPYSVCRTLDYAYSDFCVSQVARSLGDLEQAQRLGSRALSYRNLFDPETGFMRGKTANGSWETPFDPCRWGGSYIEGGPWQHSFNVPHDPEGLASLHGGREQLCRRLDQMLESRAEFSIGSYPEEIHEMTEMAVSPFGQYAHSNQPVHHCLFLYAACGEPEKTSYWVNRVARELYSPDSLPGDEDNGEMAAWYVFACLGMYPLCPGKNEYIRFTPAAKKVEIL